LTPILKKKKKKKKTVKPMLHPPHINNKNNNVRQHTHQAKINAILRQWAEGRQGASRWRNNIHSAEELGKAEAGNSRTRLEDGFHATDS
jgi:hypothetical protein